MKYFCLLIFVFAFVLNSCGQDFKGRIILGKIHAEKEIQEALSSNFSKYYYDSTERRTNINTKEKAIEFAEAITFKIFGEEQIKSERPYECYLINDYWYISGTLPEGYKGGCFEIIFDSKDSKIIRLTHYK